MKAAAEFLLFHCLRFLAWLATPIRRANERALKETLKGYGGYVPKDEDKS